MRNVVGPAAPACYTISAMFNEILNGTKSLEPSAPAGPYRTASEPAPMLACTSCKQEFPAGQALAGRCRNCAPQVDAALAALRGNAKADYTDYGAQELDRELNWRLLTIGITIVLAIAFAFFRYGMRGQADDYEYEYGNSSPYTPD